MAGVSRRPSSSDWVQGRTYRFDLRQTRPHWWTVAVTEEQTGRRFTLGSIRTPCGWGLLECGDSHAKRPI